VGRVDPDRRRLRGARRRAPRVTPSRSWRSDAAAVAGLVLAVGVAYANAFGASFQFDDWDVVVRDPRVQGIGAWWDAMPGIRPLLKLSYALGHASGTGVVGFHAVNVAIHAANAVLVFVFCGRLVARHVGEPAAARRIALTAALLFALHPIQTEAVTYVSGRSTSLSTGLSLASLLLALPARGATAPAASAASLLALGLALGVKESAVWVPGVLVLWHLTDPADSPSPRAALRATAAHWLVLLAALAAAAALPAYRSLVATSLATRPPFENLVAQSRGLAWLAGQVVRFDRLNADPALAAATRVDPAGFAFGLALLGLVGWAFVALRRRPLAAFAVLFPALALAPTNTLVARLDLANDRQAYAALIGPALLVALGLERLRASSRPAAGFAPVVAVALVLAFGVATHRRNAVYRDEVVFWRDVVAKAPHNARGFNNLGFALAARCDAAGAERAFERALALDPGSVRAAVNLRLLREGALPGTPPPAGCAPD